MKLSINTRIYTNSIYIYIYIHFTVFFAAHCVCAYSRASGLKFGHTLYIPSILLDDSQQSNRYARNSQVPYHAAGAVDDTHAEQAPQAYSDNSQGTTQIRRSIVAPAALSPLAAGLSLTSTRVPGQTNGTKPHTHVVSNTSHVNHTRATDNTRDGTDVPLNWVFGSSALSEHAAVNHSEWRHVEQLRRKVREAMNSAARRTLLDSLSRTADAPPLPHPSAVHYTDTTHGALASSSWAGPTRTGDVHGVSPSASLPHFRSATKDDRAEAAGPPLLLIQTATARPMRRRRRTIVIMRAALAGWSGCTTASRIGCA